MKISVFILFIFFYQFSFGQNIHSQSNPNTIEDFQGTVRARRGIINGIYIDTVSANLTYIKNYPSAQIVVGNTIYLRDSTATKWIVGNGGGAGELIGGPITSVNDFIGFNPGTGLSVSDWIDSVFYAAQPPTATLTGGGTFELTATTTQSATLNWSSSRQVKTATLASIVVAGISQSFAQPSQPGTVSGTQGVTVTNNTDITYSNITTATDGKSATATTTFSFLPKRYFGWINVSDTAGIGTFGYDDSKITSLGNELSASKVKSFNTGSPSGVQFLVYAYYYTAGNLTHMDLNGFPSIDAFNVVQRNFTNALGFVGQWIIYWNKNGQTLSSDVIAY